MMNTAIKTWSKDDQPREKISMAGARSLSEVELLAILLRSGSREGSAVDLARMIMRKCGNNLNALSQLGVADIIKMGKGIGICKAASVVAALELGRRRVSSEMGESPVLRCSSDIYRYLFPKMVDLDHEELWVVYLNPSCEALRVEPLFVGGIDTLLVDPRILYRKALEYKAHSIVIAHNHPSGNKRPSTRDVELTHSLSSSGRMLGVCLLDHIIVTASGYYSFADSGMLTS